METIKNYILPNFMSYGRNEIFIKIQRDFPFVFNNNARIYSIYGVFPNAIWNGGRVVLENKNTSIRQMKKVEKYYGKNGVKITFTFTNQLLEEKHLDDYYCNLMCKIYDNGFNEVLVASKSLEDYIREHYKGYKINKSITATIKDGNEETEDYNLVVIDKKNNRNYKYLESIKDKDKIEILCDEVCINNCKYTNQHYKEISERQLGYINNKDPLYASCKIPKHIESHNFIQSRNTHSLYYVSPKMIEEYYTKQGFKYFKLSGRDTYGMIPLMSIIDYLIKKEYQNDIRTYILERMLLEYAEEAKRNIKAQEG